MTLKLFQYLDDNINSAPPKYQSFSFKTVGVVWIQRSKMAVILYIYRYIDYFPETLVLNL